jgi:hypothetical protein
MWRVILTQQYQYRMKQAICLEACLRDKWAYRACVLPSGREGCFHSGPHAPLQQAP